MFVSCQLTVVDSLIGILSPQNMTEILRNQLIAGKGLYLKYAWACNLKIKLIRVYWHTYKYSIYSYIFIGLWAYFNGSFVPTFASTSSRHYCTCAEQNTNVFVCLFVCALAYAIHAGWNYNNNIINFSLFAKL